MKHLRILGLFVCILLLFLSFKIHSTSVKEKDKPQPLKLIGEMVDSIKKIKNMRFHLKALEKIGDKYLSAESDIKLQLYPKKMYFKNPAKKLEILYLENEHGNNALVKPHVFPYTPMYLDPYGSLMRKNQHYTIHELGFGFIARTITMILFKDPDNAAKHLSYLGTVQKAGQVCHMITYEDQSFTYVDYTVKKDENISIIALKNHVSDYMIRSKNNLTTSYTNELKEGKVIKIPTNYCYKATLYISDKTKLPVSINIYNNKELWEGYEYSNVYYNQGIDPAEFKRNNKEYRF